MISNPGRTVLTQRELLSSLVDSPAWLTHVRSVGEQIVGPLRAQLLTNATLSEREQTGYVMALRHIRRVIEQPYHDLADAMGQKPEELIPEEVARLFQ